MDTQPDSQAPITLAPVEVTPTPLTPAKKHHHLFLKILFWIVGTIVVIVILALTTLYVLGLIYKDSGPIDDSGLMLPVVTVPDAQNAYFDLQNAGVSESIFSSATSSVSEKQAAGTAMIAAFDSAAQKPAYQDPAAVDQSKISVTSDSPPVYIYRNIDELSNEMALKVAQSGHPTAGLQQALAGVSVGHKIEGSQAFLIEWLVGVSVKTQSLETVQAIATSTTISSKDLIAAASVLNSYTDDGSGLSKAFKMQYYQDFKSVIGLFGNKNRPVHTFFYWHPNESLGYAIAETRDRIQVAQGTCSDYQNTANTYGDGLLPKNSLLWPFTSNLLGKMVLEVSALGSNTTKKRECDGNMMVGATQLILVLKAYEQDHHTLPATLNDLVPAYISVLALDPYSGQLFRYEPTQKLIYSIGQDHKDVGGNPGTDWSVANNPTFSF